MIVIKEFLYFLDCANLLWEYSCQNQNKYENFKAIRSELSVTVVLIMYLYGRILNVEKDLLFKTGLVKSGLITQNSFY